MRTIRYELNELQERALSSANPAQLPVLEKLIQNNWAVTKIIHNGDACAICVGTSNEGAWLTPDGKFHRRIKGKAHVRINITTLQRIW